MNLRFFGYVAPFISNLSLNEELHILKLVFVPFACAFMIITYLWSVPVS